MFTGLIVEMGTVSSLRKSPGGARLRIKADHVYHEAELGDSISINGTCLTVVEKKKSPVPGFIQALPCGRYPLDR